MNGTQYENSSGSCLVNSIAYYNWRNTPDRDKGVAMYLALFGDNKSKFKELYGRQDFCWNGDVRHWIWVRMLNCNFNARFLIICSSEGTTYEINFPKDYNWSTEEFENCSKEALEILKGIFKL